MGTRVYFLGAGASKAAVPTAALTADLLSKAIAQAGRGTTRPKWLKSVRRFTRELSGGRHPLPTIDEILAIIDSAIAQDCWLSATHSPKQLVTLRRDIVDATRWYIYDGLEYSRPKTNVLERLVEHAGERPVFVTLNWDTLLERASQRVSYGVACESNDGGFEVCDAPDSVMVLKPHGSVNWHRCGLCGTLRASSSREGYRCLDCHGAPMGEPVIVAPTLLPGPTPIVLQEVWRLVEDKLRRCNEVVIIGYSLPVQDVDVRLALLRSLGAQGRDGKRFTIVDMESSAMDATANRYQSLFGAKAMVEYHAYAKGLVDWLDGVPASFSVCSKSKASARISSGNIGNTSGSSQRPSSTSPSGNCSPSKSGASA
jgi:hypothetical protein